QAELDAQRYGAIDALDDARDLIDTDAAAAHLLLALSVSSIIAHAFLVRGKFQPRRKRAITALADLDPVAGDLVRLWSTQTGPTALATVATLAHHVLGVDTFFAWTSDVDPVPLVRVQPVRG